MFDSKGRVWITAGGGCRMFDPRTDEITLVPGCRAGHHLQIDDNDVLWADAGGAATSTSRSGTRQVMTRRPAGGSRSFSDTNANGVRDEPRWPWNAPLDRHETGRCGRAATTLFRTPVDGSVWISVHSVPGHIVRVDPDTGLSEVYEPPYMNERSPIDAYLPHGIDVDRETGVIWTGLNSGHYAEFDRSKCTGPLNGPEATGSTAPKGGRCTKCRDRSSKA